MGVRNTRTPASGATRRSRQPWWSRLATSELLDLRFRDLQLSIDGTALEDRLAQLDRELARTALPFRPYVWLSTDWFTPDGLTGFAVPFYLAHPRLVRLERLHMLEAEGGTHSWCMRLLRHETAHALDNAYRLRRRKGWREVFGHASRPYRESYAPVPASRDFVHNLDYWYAQSHPVEDFAETFSIWLQPNSRWRSRYHGWPALEKLRYVDGLMRELADGPPPKRSREREETLPHLRTTLREHYRDKQARYEVHQPSPYDGPLRRIFASGSTRDSESAAAFLRRWRAVLVQRVSAVTSQPPYLLQQILKELTLRCRHLGLRVVAAEADTLMDVAALLGDLTQRLARGKRPWFSR